MKLLHIYIESIYIYLHMYLCIYLYIFYIFIYIYIYLYIIYLYIYISLYILYIYIYMEIYMHLYPSECQIFYLFRCVLSSVLPLRSVGRSNFDKDLHNLITLIQKRHKIMIEMKLLYYTYLDICIYSMFRQKSAFLRKALIKKIN